MRKTIVLSIVLIIGTVISGCDSDKKDMSKYLLLLLKPVFSGEAVWVRSNSAGSAASNINAVAISGDAIYAAGYISGNGAYTFGSQSVSGSSGVYSALLVKYDKEGSVIWARSVSAGTGGSNFYSVSVASDGSVYAAGTIYGPGSSTFGTQSVYTNSASGVVLVKYDKDGNALWARSAMAALGMSYYNAVVTDGDGVYAAGGIFDNVTYTFGSLTVAGTCAGALGNTVLVKYSVDGTELWARSVSAGESSSIFNSLAVTGDGIYAAGNMDGWGSGRFTFGTQTITCAYSGSNTVLVKYNRNGDAVWARSVTYATTPSEFYSVSADGDGIYASGYIYGNRTLWFGHQSVTGAYASFRNALLVKYDKDGVAHWARSVSTGNERSEFMAVSARDDGVYAAGIINAGAYTFGTRSVAGAFAGDNAVLVKYK